MSKEKKKPVSAEKACEEKEEAPVDKETIDTSKWESEIKNLQDALAKAEQEKENYLDLARRSRAEFENYRKRNATLYTDTLQEGKNEVLTKLLPTIDNLERALQAKTDSAEALFQGVEMIYKNLMETLEGLSCVSLEAKPGAAFDPEIHNAVMTVPADEEHPDNTIFDVFQQGYKVNDKVIRHAMVRVSKAE